MFQVYHTTQVSATFSSVKVVKLPSLSDNSAARMWKQVRT